MDINKIKLHIFFRMDMNKIKLHIFCRTHINKMRLLIFFRMDNNIMHLDLREKFRSFRCRQSTILNRYINGIIKLPVYKAVKKFRIVALMKLFDTTQGI